MEHLQESIKQGALDIMIKDAIADINYFNYYKDYENRDIRTPDKEQGTT